MNRVRGKQTHDPLAAPVIKPTGDSDVEGAVIKATAAEEEMKLTDRRATQKRRSLELGASRYAEPRRRYPSRAKAPESLRSRPNRSKLQALPLHWEQRRDAQKG